MTIYKPNPEAKRVEKKSHSKIKIPEDAKPLAAKNEAAVPGSAVLSFPKRYRICVYIMTFVFVALAVIAIFLGVCYFTIIIHKGGIRRKAEFRYYEVQRMRNAGMKSQQRVGGSFLEDIEMEIDKGMFERINVPPILESRRSTVLHDFETNWTAIADHDTRRCFVLPLNREAVVPPKSFSDLLEKYDAGYYLPDAEVVRENYQVKLPATHNLARFGLYIAFDCRFYSTYELVPDNDFVREKRSACEMAGDLYCLGEAGTAVLPFIKLTRCV